LDEGIAVLIASVHGATEVTKQFDDQGRDLGNAALRTGPAI